MDQKGLRPTAIDEKSYRPTAITSTAISPNASLRPNKMAKPVDLSSDEINRYSRQIILPSLGVKGQLDIVNASVLIIGAGGLGCPCALYLAGAGVGHIGIVDYDQVELNNLHRQILHKETSVGQDKVASAANSLKEINSRVKVTPFVYEFNSENALDIIKQFDVVVDATDNVATRYLINDACFFCQKPLVSGSALQMEGQLTVYQHENAPCYRCLYPIPPPPATVTNCGEGGVLGVIPGTIGVLQALQVINIINRKDTLAGVLLLFDGTNCSFRRVKLRERSEKCALCGTNPRIKKLIDYEAFCCSKANDKNPNLHLIRPEQRISAFDYSSERQFVHLLIDVRSKQEFEICHLPLAVNIPLKEIGNAKVFLETSDCPVYIVCRRGNDSQKAVLTLSTMFPEKSIMDIKGGLHAWSKDVDSNFPVY